MQGNFEGITSEDLTRSANQGDKQSLAVVDEFARWVAVGLANCAALAEIESGAAMGAQNALLVTLGTGIGGSLIVDGAVHRGAFGMAGEPGHVVVDPNGVLCACGMNGCWEAYASATGLRNLAIRRAKTAS